MTEQRMEADRARGDVLGMTVISISEGMELGQVKQILIGPSYRVEGFVVARRRSREERVLPFAAVSSFGEDRITVERQTVLEHGNAPARYGRQPRRPLPLIGARVFTAGGRVLGKVEEYHFSVEDGSLTALELSGGFFREKTLLPGRCIIAVSPQTVMLKDEALDQALPVENPLRAGVAAAMGSVSEAAGSLAEGTRDGAKRLASGLSRLWDKDKQPPEEVAEEAVEAEPLPPTTAGPESAPAPDHDEEAAPRI